jgi:hypothetical protein
VGELMKNLVTEILMYDKEIDHALRHLQHSTISPEHKSALTDIVAKRDKLMGSIASYYSTEFPARNGNP